MLLLCSFFRLKELFQVKNGLTTWLPFLENAKNLGRPDDAKLRKKMRMALAKQQLCTCITLFSRRCMVATLKLPNFTRPLHRVGEHDAKIFVVFFLNLDTVLSDSTPENFANFCTN